MFIVLVGYGPVGKWQDFTLSPKLPRTLTKLFAVWIGDTVTPALRAAVQLGIGASARNPSLRRILSL